MKIEMEVRRIYWVWFTHRWAVHGEGGGHGVTGAKLCRHEETILNDDILWQDVIGRHALTRTWPWDAMQDDKANYDHAAGNFWGMIYPLLTTGRQYR